MNRAPRSSSTLLCTLLLSAAYSGQCAAAADERTIRGSEGFATDHAADELRDPLSFTTLRTPAAALETKSRSNAKPDSAVASVSLGDSWIHDATATPFADEDQDGYFHYLRVRFDPDSVFGLRYVYAKIYLSADGNAWEHLYTTHDFAVYGTSDDDDYEVETELVSGYSTGLYDVLIELWDSDDEVLVDEFGPTESSALSVLPLEDSVRDGVEPPPEEHHHGGGGAASWLLLPGLFAAVLARRRELRTRSGTATRF